MTEKTESGASRSRIGTTSMTLINAAKNLRSSSAWHRLVEMYSPKVYAACRKAGVPPSECRAVCNDVWLAAVKYLPSFEKDEGEKGQFRCWLGKVTKSKVGDYFRKNPQRQSLRSNHELNQFAWPQEEESSEDSDDANLAKRVLNAIQARFGSDGLEVFMRLVVEGQRAAEVADATGKTPGAIYTLKSRILDWVRDEMGAAGSGDNSS